MYFNLDLPDSVKKELFGKADVPLLHRVDTPLLARAADLYATGNVSNAMLLSRAQNGL